MPDQVGDVDRGTELRKLNRAHESEDDADQEGNEGHDPDGIRAALLDHFEQVDPAVARLAAHELGEGDRDIAQKRQELGNRHAVTEARVADALKQRNPARFAASALLLGNGLGKLDQTFEPDGQALAVLVDSAFATELADLGQERDQPAVPVGELLGVKRDAFECARVEFADQLRGRRHVALQMPGA